MTPSTNPARDEAVQPITPERLAEVRERFNAIPHADPDSLTGHVKGMLALIDSLASAPAPASGGVDAVAVKALGPIPQFDSFTINPVGEGDICVEGSSRFAHERDVAKLFKWARAAQALLSSLSSAATSGSEAGGEADKPFGYFVERDDGVEIFRRVGKPFPPSPLGYRYRPLYEWPSALAKPSSPAGGDMREAVAEYGMKALPEDVCLRMEREARNLANLWANGDEPVRRAALALQVRTHVAALSPSTSAAEPVAWRFRLKDDQRFGTRPGTPHQWTLSETEPANTANQFVVEGLAPLYATPPAPAAGESAQGLRRCPTCSIHWDLFKPAKCDGSDHYRCIECKAIYPGSSLDPNVRAALESSHDR